jgi:hypothetical protein
VAPRRVAARRPPSVVVGARRRPKPPRLAELTLELTKGRVTRVVTSTNPGCRPFLRSALQSAGGVAQVEP